MAEQHPVFRMVRYEWLAQETGYAQDTIRAMACGRRRCTPRFRAACMQLLGRSERELFHLNDSSASAPESSSGSDDRAGAAVA